MFQNNLLMAAASNASGGGTAITSVGNSALYNLANNENLTRNDVAGTSNQKQYLSWWIYRGVLNSALQAVFHCDDGTDSNREYMIFNTDNTIQWVSITGGSTKLALHTSRVFRDIGWYHIELLFDTTQAVASSRNIMRVNGERITEFTTETNFDLNQTFGSMGSVGDTFRLGAYRTTSYGYDGYMAECVRIDGDPAGISTGEYDSTGLYWTPKSSTVIEALTFGNNGFYLDNTTNAQTDASGEAHNFTNNNTVTTSTHTPTNLDVLLDPLASAFSTPVVLSNGNTNITNSGAVWRVVPATVGMLSGKYYWEIQISGSGTYSMVGIATASYPGYTGFPLAVTSTTNGAFMLARDGYKYSGAGGRQAYTTTWASGDRLGVAFDADNGFVYVSKNGTWYASSDPTSGATGTGAMFGSLTDLPYYPASHIYTGYSHQYYFKEDDWSASAPTGYSAVQNSTALAAATTRTASDTNKYFQTTLYEGNGAGQRVGAFQPFDSTFTVGNSALFNSTNYLARTPDSTSNAKTATFSKWFKPSDVASDDNLFACWKSTSPLSFFGFYIQAAGPLFVFNYTSGSYDWYLETTRKFKDVTEWTHFMFQVDTTQSTSSDRAKIFVNGVQETVLTNATYPSLNFANYFNTDTVPNYIGPRNGSGGSMGPEGYGAETALVDGTAYAPSYFGETDTSTNRWVPKALTGITWGTHGFYQDYADSGNLGDDESGNGNDFTNNGTVTQTTDSPTTNLAVWNPNMANDDNVLSNGNQTQTTIGAGYARVPATTISASTGKWYCEMSFSNDGASNDVAFGIDDGLFSRGLSGLTDNSSTSGTNLIVYKQDGQKRLGATNSSYGATFASGDVIGVALDLDSSPQTVTFYKAGASQGAISLTTQNIPYFFSAQTFSGGAVYTANFGATAFAQTPPTGHIALAQDNLAGTDQFISAFSWIKNRDATDNHMLFDRVRGATNDLHSNTTDIEVTNVNTVQSFLEAGVQIGNDVEVNTSNESYALWNWMIEATGSGASNEAGSINTTSTLVDQTLGLSISKYTGTGSNATVGHGLGTAPGMIIIKNLGVTDAWAVYYGDNTDYLVLNTTAATADDATMWNDTTPSSTVFSIGTNHQVNASSENYIAYCFAPSQFISIGSYEGNGNANGAFAPTINSLGIPIQPVFFFSKNADATNNWDMRDIVRSPYNSSTNNIQPSTSSAEYNGTDYVDIVTGGLKIRTSSANLNGSAKTIIYLAMGTPIIDTSGRIIAGR